MPEKIKFLQEIQTESGHNKKLLKGTETPRSEGRDENSAVRGLLSRLLPNHTQLFQTTVDKALGIPGDISGQYKDVFQVNFRLI